MNSKSIVLIGMPGCGKSTLGEILSKKLEYDFIDMDIFIEEYSGSKISDLFKISEEHFRNIETEVCEILGKTNRTVIASGGGIVKKKENIDYLKDSIIIYIDRDLDNILSDINVENRPLLRDDKSRLFSLYKERHHLYNKYADFVVENNETIESTLKNIIKALE